VFLVTVEAASWLWTQAGDWQTQPACRYPFALRQLQDKVLGCTNGTNQHSAHAGCPSCTSDTHHALITFPYFKALLVAALCTVVCCRAVLCCVVQATVLRQIGLLPDLPCVTGPEQATKAADHEAAPSNALIDAAAAQNGKA
jgi:hypothetical protein